MHLADVIKTKAIYVSSLLCFMENHERNMYDRHYIVYVFDFMMFCNVN